MRAPPRVRLLSIAESRRRLAKLGWHLCSIEIKNDGGPRPGGGPDYQIWRATASAWKRRVPGGHPVRATAEVRRIGGQGHMAWKRHAALVLLQALGG